jgi:hypothetical protein
MTDQRTRDSKSVPDPIVGVRADEMTGTPAQIAARAVVTGKMGDSIPSRQFLLGECDHSAFMSGVIQFTEAVIQLCDTAEADGGPHAGKAAEEVRRLMTPNVR